MRPVTSTVGWVAANRAAQRAMVRTRTNSQPNVGSTMCFTLDAMVTTLFQSRCKYLEQGHSQCQCLGDVVVTDLRYELGRLIPPCNIRHAVAPHWPFRRSSRDIQAHFCRN